VGVRINPTQLALPGCLAFCLLSLPAQPSKLGSNDLPSLRATIRLTSQTYCGGLNKGIGWSSFQLHIQIHNETGNPVILCKKYVEIYQPLLAYARPDGTPGDAAYNPIFDSYGFDRRYPRNLKRDYLEVAPRKEYEFDQGTAVLFHLPSEISEAKGTVIPGNYFLSVEISTWGGPPDVVDVLRTRWQAEGNLFADGIWSDFIPVTVAPPQPLLPCERKE
jgi:hypothetical protein